jgi:heptose I phosphotransferase
VQRAAPPFERLRSEADPFAWLEARAGDVFRDRPERRTFRFEHGGAGWFAKLHYGVGVRELLKNLVLLRLPVFDAGAEVRAADVLAAAGVPTLEPVAWGWCGRDPLRRRSFVVTREVVHDATLDDLAATLTGAARRRTLTDLARLVRTLHDAGVNHRDLYLVHLLRSGDRDVLIDLHRAQLRRRVPARWRAKDLAALAFSAAAAGPLSLADRLRFVRAYADRPLREELAENGAFWCRVARRAERMRVRGARG